MITRSSGNSAVNVSSRGVFSIGALARLLGVAPATLRTWEERYGMVVPQRSAGAQRVYSRRDLEQLRFVCAQIEDGATAADAHRLLGEHIEHGLPLAVDEPTADAGGARATRIALVERDVYAADLGEHALRSAGYDVRVARTIGAADELVTSATVSLVVIDIMIDCGAGLAWCAKRHLDVPVVAVSVLDQALRARAAGARRFVRKPLEPAALVATVRDLIGAGAAPALVPIGP
jgi:DNA-binding transcriptional MerR regulator